MKKIYLPFAMGMIATAAIAQPSPIPSQQIKGISATSISPNGQWLVGSADGNAATEGSSSLGIYDLVNGKSYIYYGDGSGLGYVDGLRRSVSNDGTVIGEINDQPAYWKDGRWRPLPLAPGVSSAGAAITGSITPDGSMIVGALGETSLSLEDVQMDYACVWYRNADGTYSEPEFLPSVGRDLFGQYPQYVHALSVSDDGNVISGIMRGGSGFFMTPLIYIKGEDGKWTGKQIGLDLINPTGRPVPPNPGDYRGPNPPNYEEYLPAGVSLSDLDDDFDKWAREQLEMGVDENDLWYIAIYKFYPQFMVGEDKEVYEYLAKEFYDAFSVWNEKDKAWQEFQNALEAEGYNFVFNSAFISPDGKKAYYTAVKTTWNPGNTNPEYQGTQVNIPVIYDVATGEFEFCSSRGIYISSIAEDYSIFGHRVGVENGVSFEDAWVYPQGQYDAVSFTTYLLNRNLNEAYDWMEENMVISVVTGVTSSGQEQYGDRAVTGIPFVTPDQSLIAFGNETSAWEVLPDYGNVSFVVNTGLNSTGVEEVSSEAADIEVGALRGGLLTVSGIVKSVKVYNLSGSLVASFLNPASTVSTGLASGVYVVRAEGVNGELKTVKVLL